MVSRTLAVLEDRLEEERSKRRDAEALAALLEPEKADVAEQNRRLEHLNDKLHRPLFGNKSEEEDHPDKQSIRRSWADAL